MNADEIARLRVVHQPQECASNCDIPDCHFCHQESWSIWRGDKYVSGPYETENAALLTALEQSQAALATTQLKMVDDREDYQKLTAEAQREASALRARLEAAKKALRKIEQTADKQSELSSLGIARAAVAEMEK